jgi:2-polyprenyl-6-hydroxyphenyl methylase/3-demethylubiquinone-9 3-methyltransferase
MANAAFSSENGDLFSGFASEWWKPKGAFKALHDLNPLRVAYIQRMVAAHFGAKGFKKLTVADVGCGGGLLAEAMAERGAKVKGIDISEASVAAAQDHAKQVGLTIDYAKGTAQDLASAGEKFDLVLSFEVVEHVRDRKAYYHALASLLKPSGLLVMATVNRTVKSYLLGIVAAEYVLGWIPPGTHDWDDFVKPSELADGLSVEGLSVQNLMGVAFDPLRGRFAESPHRLDVNYMASFALDVS